MLNDLNAEFSVPGLRFEFGNGKLVRAAIDTPIAQGELYLQGAHVTSWCPAGQRPVLWQSEQSNYAAGKAIRGGVPICFPWFGSNSKDTALPAHGFARTAEWRVADSQTTADGAIQLRLTTTIDSFLLDFQVEFGRELKMTLQTQLSAESSSRTSFEVALHTYFAVSDIRSISIAGLEEASYIDKVDQSLLKHATGSAIRFVGETDRVYLETQAACELSDPGFGRVIRISKSGSQSTVVWNPWIDKSKRMVDFGDDEWPGMVCIETANVGASCIELAPGATHTTVCAIAVSN
jgi:glucose-6-phosphate 1-epimerase